MNDKFIRGTFYLTAGTLISKILGFIYIIPFTMLVGNSGYALYKYAYGPYTIMLSLSTLGLPLAVSKYVAKYNGMGNFQAGKELLKYGFTLMIITGFFSFMLIFSSAPLLASFVTSVNDTSGNTYSDVVFVIRMISFALIVVPPMSLLRGFFQGNQQMGPSALSTVIEQFSRVVFILLGSYMTIKFFDASIKYAVGIGTFGAFVGGVASLLTLILFYIKRRNIFKYHIKNASNNFKIPLLIMFRELVSYAVPFVLVGLAIPIYQNIDTYTINYLFKSIGYSQLEAEEINSIIGLSQILVLIPVSLATSFGMSLIPGIAESYNNGKHNDIVYKVKKTYQILMFFILPSAVGLSLLSNPIYTMIFGFENNPRLGGDILGWYAPMAIFFSLFTISAAILQGINKQKQILLGMVIGIIIKITLNYLLIFKLHEIGPVIATFGGYTFSVVYNFYILKKYIKLPIISLFKPIVPISILVFIMSICIILMNFIIKFSFVNSLNEYWQDFFISIVSVIFGSTIYFLISSKLGILKLLFK